MLAEELGSRVIERYGRLFLVKGRDMPLWAQNVWVKPGIFRFSSISQAVTHLRGQQRSWWLHSTHHHRRAELIQKQLPPIKPKPIEFMASVPEAPLGSWTLLDAGTMVYSPVCSNPFPDGEVEFVENKTEPPSRAYLKLWELFTLVGRHPAAGEKVVDLGAAPGGWTWVLDRLGCHVVSVDKAPLAVTVSERVEVRAESAFGLSPIQGATWMFSDVICYPERLLELVKKWESVVPNLVCTIKFQGPTDFAIIKEFLSIPGSRILHLNCNRHELTWWRFA